MKFIRKLSATQDLITRAARIACAAGILAFVAGCGVASPTPLVVPTPVALQATEAPSTATAEPSPSPAPLPTWTPLPVPAADGLFVDPTVDLGAVSPLIFGTNYGPWVSLRPETLPLAYGSGLTIIRYPGGEWGDANKLQSYQIDQLVDLARKMGAEPYIHVRFRDSTPAEAAETVRYANIEKSYGIKYWSIGNEPSLYEGRGLAWDAEAFSRTWREFADAMRAVDPSIVLIGPEIHQWAGRDNVDPKDSAGRDWLRTFLQMNGDAVDVVSIHRYPFPNNTERTPATADELRANAQEWTQIIRNLRDAVRTETGRDLPVAITEMNSHWSQAVSGEATPDSHLSAIWLGDVLGRLVMEKVDIVTQFLLVSGGESGFGLLERYGPRPAYFTYQMYKQFGDQLRFAATDDPLVTVYAAGREDGALTVLLINLKSEEVTKPLRIAGIAGMADGTEAEVIRFDQAHNAESDGTLQVGTATEVTLPPESMTLLVIQ